MSGSGGSTRPGVTAHVQSFCQFLRDRGKVACELPERFHGHAYRIYERIEPKLVDDGVLFIGDAAGLAYPQSGEGIRPAVESGLLAADVLIAAAGDYSRTKLAPYASEIHKRFGTPRRGAVSDWLPAAFLRFAAARLMATRWFTKSVVLDRWFLHAADPVLPVKRPAPALSATLGVRPARLDLLATGDAEAGARFARKPDRCGSCWPAARSALVAVSPCRAGRGRTPEFRTGARSRSHRP